MRIKLITIYKTFVNKHLTLYNAIQTGLLMGSGDVIAQVFVEKKSWETFEFARTAKFFGLGATFVGPTISTWYKFLDKKFTSQVGQLVNKKSVLYKKVALDQLIFAPSFLVILVSIINAFEGKDVQHIKSELKDTYPDILLANYKLWPWVQLVNFYYVPLRHQVLVVQCVAILWNTYVSWKTHSSGEVIEDLEKSAIEEIN